MSAAAATPEQQDGPLIVGRYALFDVLASGGMATVHLGRLLGREGFGRTVAVKRLHAHFTNDPEFVTMFMDEARIVARIRHPNVVPMVDVIESAQGLFLVMEYIHGETFSRVLRAARNANIQLPVKVIASIMAAVLHGLHSAHETRDSNGELIDVIHRDVSPQNIIVGSDGIARILDFGVAKAAGRAQVTREGQIKGKLAYMSPEQIRGKVDRRADVFACAVCLWEALTGKRLHEGARDVEIVTRIMQGSFPKPSELRPDVPPDLDAIIMRGLAADPDKRYPSAREMAIDLERKVGLAPASEVGPWVEKLAENALRVRAERIEAMEKAAASIAPAMSVPPPPPAPPPAPGSALGSPPSDPRMQTGPYQMPPMPRSDLSSTGGTPIGTEVPFAPRGSKKDLAYVIAAGSFFLALALIGGILMVVALTRSPSPAAPASSTSASPLPLPAPSATTSANAAPEETPVVVPSATVSVDAAAPKPPPGPSQPWQPAPTKKKCEPYTIDAQGHRKYNRDCLDE